MQHHRIQLLAITGLSAVLAATDAFAGLVTDNLPGPGILGLLALGIVGAIGISRLRK